MTKALIGELESFVRLKTKSNFDNAARIRLKELVYQVPPADLRSFWLRWTGSTAFSRAQRIPDWKAKDQELYFGHQLSSFSYTPGKLSFEEHVIAQLTRYIEEERAMTIRYKNLPFVNKFVFTPLGYLGMVVLMLLLCAIFRTPWSGILSVALYLGFLAASSLSGQLQKKKSRRSSKGD